MCSIADHAVQAGRILPSPFCSLEKPSIGYIEYQLVDQPLKSTAHGQHVNAAQSRVADASECMKGHGRQAYFLVSCGP